MLGEVGGVFRGIEFNAHELFVDAIYSGGKHLIAYALK
jgi:hypothetical protein